jgi:hypothetical protein
MTEGLSVADALALSDKNNNFMDGWMNNPFIYLVWMYCMRWFNNGDGNFTQAELMDGLGRQDILGNQRSILDGLSNIRYDNLSNVANLTTAMTSGFNSVNSGLAENRFAQQQCCCETQKELLSMTADNFKNTCDITTAIHAEGEATRALINDNTMQALRDKLADRDRDLLYANFQNSQYLQNSYLIDALRPVSRPAYLTCSPYTTSSSYCAGNYGCSSCGS